MKVLSKQGGSVVEKHGNRVIKKGIRVSKHEADMMNIVKEVVPVPNVFGCYTLGNETIIEMEYIEGEILQNILPNLTNEQKQLLTEDLKSIISRMRQLTSYGTIGPVKNESLPISGVYESERHLNQNLLDKLDKSMPQHNINLIFSGALTEDHDIVMTHGDLHPKNIIVRDYRIVAILDWECAGFYPEYWEYTKTLSSIQWNNVWVPIIHQALNPYPREFAVIYYFRTIFQG
jgi:aminoglycoside phosphotransferase (APT) family kinase protein